MSAHTPGPWNYQPHGAEIIAPGVVVLDDDGACGDPECCGARSYWISVSAEDARLIAAAPELLESMQTYIAALDGWENTNKAERRVKTAEAGMRAAIAKATGSAA